MIPFKKHIIIISGEASGDEHGASLISDLKQQQHTDLRITGLGGVHMQAQGAEILFPLAKLGITGVSGLFQHFFTLKKVFYMILEHIKQTTPDLIVLIDYPGFNLRLLKKIKQIKNIPILYYISPQLWAWKPKRIEVIKKYVTHMAVIFPFEKKLYEKHHVPVSFVGHPLLQHNHLSPDHTKNRLTFDLPPNKCLIALLPGSRISEIESHLPILKKTAALLLTHHPELHFVIPIANSLSSDFVTSFWSDGPKACSFIEGHAIDIAHLSDIILVASGTASLECALLQKPMAIIYRASTLTALIASQCIRVRYLGLCNLLSNKMIIPEFLQYDCTPEHLTEFVLMLLSDPSQQYTMKKNLDDLKKMLSQNKADTSLSELVFELLNLKFLDKRSSLL